MLAAFPSSIGGHQRHHLGLNFELESKFYF